MSLLLLLHGGPTEPGAAPPETRRTQVATASGRTQTSTDSGRTQVTTDSGKTNTTLETGW